MPVKNLGKGRLLTIKLIRMGTQQFAKGIVETAKVKFSRDMGVLDALLDFDTHHYWQVMDSGVGCDWVVGIPKDKLEGTPAETTYQLINEYIRALDPNYPAIIYATWTNTRWARTWRVENQNTTKVPKAPQPDADRVFVEFAPNDRPRVMFAVKKHKRFK